jgi:predicted nucleotidyltransferase
MSTVSQAVVKKLREKFADHLVAVAMFGSAARGEADERSDLDFLVVLGGIPRNLERRYQVYKPIHDATIQTGRVRDITVIDLDEEFIRNEDAEITPFMLNIASDAIVLYDREGELASFLERVRRLIELARLERYKTKDGKYGWKPKHGVLRVVEA